MKVLILNSGVGSRMGKLTQSCPKCLLKIKNDESIFARQLKAIRDCKITEVIVTTGEHEHELLEESKLFPELNITFVNNPLYASTNYIYSIYLAQNHLNDDMIIMHGDLVFDKELLNGILNDNRPSLCLVNKQICQPLKDFKVRLVDDTLREVAIDIFDDNCYALMPIYKLSYDCMKTWLNEINVFVKKGITNVYAEKALNNIVHKLNIKPMSYAGYYISEIDTPEDYIRAERKIFMIDNGTYFEISALKRLLKKYDSKKPFVIMGRHIKGSNVDRFLDTLDADIGKYFNVKENPSEESVADAQRAFEKFEGDLIISIGGGSAIDTAKAIKYNLLGNTNYKNLTHIAIPTTAGSGSEATRFSVIYRNSIKCSLEDDSLLPENVILDSALLYSLSDQQRKVSMIDALCHAIESLLSRNATNESKSFAKYAIKTILDNYKAFINKDTNVYDKIFEASNYAGRAINISKTAFGHAMSYTLTSEYGIKHGQAVVICLIYALKYAENNYQFERELKETAKAIDCEKDESIACKLLAVYNDLHMQNLFDLSNADSEELAKKVNADRLNNSVIFFDNCALKEIYAEIIKAFEN